MIISFKCSSEQISPGDIVWDIGAHYGYFSLKASCLVGDEGKVLSIEPTPSTYKKLYANTSDIKNIEIYNLAFFSNNYCMIDLFYNATGIAMALIIDDMFKKEKVRSLASSITNKEI